MRTQAIIIKKQSIKEYDQIITLYTKDFGKLSAIAKSSLKNTSMQSMHLDCFNLVDLELVNGRSWPILTGAQVQNSFGSIKENISKIYAGYFFLEVIEKIVFDNEKDEKLWSFLINTFDNLDDNQLLCVNDFLKDKQAELLDIMGYKMDSSLYYSGNNTFEFIRGRRFYSLNLIKSMLKSE